MRVTCTLYNHWKQAATVILLARNGGSVKPPVQSTVANEKSPYFDYKVLMLERSTKSKFMPSAFVFPGGIVGSADCSSRWCQVFEKAGISDLGQTLPDIKQPTAERAPMFLENFNSKVSADIAYRISAIRECFEEAGILLFRDSSDLASSKFTFDKNEINVWRGAVTEDDNKFIDFCEAYQIVPDIWSLKEWNCWLTPTNMPAMHSGRRYDTAFYLCCLDNSPDSVHDEKEIVSSRWREPAEMMLIFNQRKSWIAPPQIYELSRLCHFQKFDDIKEFSKQRSSLGCERWLPVRTNCEDGLIAILPGDDLYPGHVDIEGNDPPPSVEGTMEETRKSSECLHRFEMKDAYDVVLQSNIPQKQGHCPPMPQDDILEKYSS